MSIVTITQGNSTEYNITAKQGKTLQITFIWVDSDGDPINLTGYTSRMQVRKLHQATLLESYSYEPAVISLTSSSGMTITALDGQVDIEVDASTMAGILPGFYNYDLELVSGGGIVYELAGGVFEMKAEATI